MKPYGIAGKIALVSGAGGGIGAAVVRTLFDEGARVMALDIDAASVDRLVASISDDRSRIRGVCLDVRDSAAVDAVVAVTETDWGPVDLVVNVAGVLSTTLIVDTDDESWDEVFDVNAKGVFYLSRAAARRMVPRRRGSIVTVGSNAAGVPRHGMAAYAASKAAAAMFTRCLGLELGEYGVRCNLVSPGSTRTPMQQALWSTGVGEETVVAGSLEKFRTGIPLQKLAEPADVADAVLFLLSDRASHITLADLCVDGGATLGS